MDSYPKRLSPLNQAGDLEEKEPFVPWWERVNAYLPNVPKNVARQWLWRHWGQSDFGWLPTHNVHFQLLEYSPTQIAEVKFWRRTEDELLGYGRHMLNLANRPGRFPLSLNRIIARTHRWPAPPIIWDRNKSHPAEPWDDLEEGHNLVEGHKRMEMAKALVDEGLLTDDLPVWLLIYE